MLSPDEWAALAISLRVALVGMVFAVPVALAVAYALARYRFPGRSILEVLIVLPLVLPPVVTGYLLLVVFGRRGPVGHALEACCGIVFAFRWTGAALAAALMAFPLIVRAMRLSIESVDRRLEAAAGTLGASPLAVFATVTLPLALPGVVAGAVLGFAKALGEFGATITFVSNIPGETQTLALALYSVTQVPGGEVATTRLAGISVVLAVGAVALSEWMIRRMRHAPGSS